MSKLHTNNHGEVDSIFNAANYSYFLKGVIVSQEIRAECIVEIFTILFFFFLFRQTVTSFTLYFESLRNQEITNKISEFPLCIGMCGTVNNV